MKYVRLVLGVLVALYAVMGLYNFGVSAAVKAGAMALPQPMAKYAPLVEAIAWWQIVALVVMLAIYLAAAWRLLRGGKAFAPYLVAFLLDTSLWLYAKTMPAYQQVFTTADQQIEYGMMATVAVGLLITWWTERSSAPAPSAA